MLLGILAVSLTVLSCSSTDPRVDNSIAVPASVGPTGPMNYQVLERRVDLPGSTPRQWMSWEAIGQNELQFVVNSGSAECEAAQVEIGETADVVRVGIKIGFKPELQNACGGASTLSVVTVALQKPLGSRRVVDLTTG